MRKIHLIIPILFLTIFCFSCKQEWGTILIDNPSDNDIKIQFDNEEEHIVEAGTKVRTEVPFTKLKLTIDGKAESIELESGYEYILNPSYANYYIYSVPYFENEAAIKRYESDYGSDITSQIGDIEVPGDYTLINPTLLMRRSWDFGLDEGSDYIDMQSGSRFNNKGYRVVKQLVRHNDIRAAYISQFFTPPSVEDIEEKIEKSKN